MISVEFVELTEGKIGMRITATKESPLEFLLMRQFLAQDWMNIRITSTGVSSQAEPYERTFTLGAKPLEPELIAAPVEPKKPTRKR